MIKTRFSPSPTGHMHIGNARTALFSFLMAKSQEGIFLLRIEDTDKLRSKKELADELMADLNWLGIHWQEGPGASSEHSPYWQSQRQEVYDRYYEKLIERGLAYPCFCSEEELALQRKIQISRGQPPRYAGTCRHLTDAQIKAKFDQGFLPSLRFRVQEDAEIAFDDLVKGRQTFLGQNIGDFIIRRADGTASFIFCNAVDDALMGVTVAMRGEDHLTNTPRQLMILRALDLKAPQYAHISLILGNDGAPLSKRNGSMSVAELREKGFLPQAILNHLARLGHYYEQSIWLNASELADFFEVKNLGTAPARFDETQLLYWQREGVLRLDEAEFFDWCGESVQALVPEKKRSEFYESVKGNVLFPSEAKVWAETLFGSLSYDEVLVKSIKETPKSYFETALTLWPMQDFKAFVQALGKTLNLKGKALFEPMRLALTGQVHGPELAQLQVLFTEKKVAERLQKALEICA